MKISEILTPAKQKLKTSGIATPFLDAELLLASALGKKREFVIGRPEYEVANHDREVFEVLIKRRASFEPVAKIIGIKEFWGQDFIVSRATLDPRPDSESLIEAALELFPDKNSAFKILDLGTGSGCLLLTILKEYPNSQGIGVDIAQDTLNIAILNSQKIGLAKRSNFILNDWTDGMEGKFDLIISNPPYIKKSDIEKLAPEVSIYEPRLALDGGHDGLEFYRKLAPEMMGLLNKEGYAIFEFGKEQHLEIKEIFENAGMNFISFKNDLSDEPRCIIVGANSAF